MFGLPIQDDSFLPAGIEDVETLLKRLGEGPADLTVAEQFPGPFGVHTLQSVSPFRCEKDLIGCGFFAWNAALQYPD